MYFDCITSKAKYQIHLSTALECLVICENKKHVPTIDAAWWNNTQQRYPNIITMFDDMKHVSQEQSIHCERSDDPIMFIVTGPQDEELMLDFMSLLAILSVAEEHDAITPLHDEWWLSLEHIYGQPRIRT